MTRAETGYRAAILDAATKLFHEKGFSQATTDEIAAQAQTTKRTMNSIWKVAAFILVMRCIDTWWLVEPNFQDVKHLTFNLQWMDLVAPIGFGGLFFGLFFWNLPQQPLLAEGAPDFQKALNHGRDH